MSKQLVVFIALMVVAVASVQGQSENCNCIATFEYLPLCASNGVTYSNPSTFKCAKRCLQRDDLEKIYDGPCGRENVGLEDCNCIATFEYLPLCASNGVTYSNPTTFACAKRCLQRNDLQKVHDGRCA